MNDSQKYIDFIEDNLDTSGESEFVNRFAVDEDFRTGFKNYIKITAAISSNIKTFGPSLNETNEIYSMLGYTIPAVLKPAPSLPANKRPILQSPLFRNLLISLGSTIVIVVAVILFINPKFDTVKDNKALKQQTIVNQSMSTKSNEYDNSQEQYRKTLTKNVNTLKNNSNKNEDSRQLNDNNNKTSQNNLSFLSSYEEMYLIDSKNNYKMNNFLNSNIVRKNLSSRFIPSLKQVPVLETKINNLIQNSNSVKRFFDFITFKRNDMMDYQPKLTSVNLQLRYNAPVSFDFLQQSAIKDIDSNNTMILDQTNFLLLNNYYLTNEFGLYPTSNMRQSIFLSSSKNSISNRNILKH